MEVIPLDIEADADHAIVWRNERLYLLDQRKLPLAEEYLELSTAEAVADAIREMVVRGAPAIGVAAGYGVVLAAAEHFRRSPEQWSSDIEQSLAVLAASRPTAVNLFWALERMRRIIRDLGELCESPLSRLLAEAKSIHEEDVAANRTMGGLGAELIERSTSVITHCNAGALATGGYGTALGVIRSAFSQGRIERVFADETRPWLQGSRLTAWELKRDGIPVTLLADGAAASCLARGGIDWVIVGSDRIAANGDVANKIGTYNLAVAARHHGVKMMVVAPTSTVDMSTLDGEGIPIEYRDADELLSCAGKRVGTAGVDVWNPVFDVTPAGLIDAIVTEKGVVHLPDAEKMKKMMSS